MNEEVLNKFYKYVLENINSGTGKVYISKEIEDTVLLDLVQKLSFDHDDYMNLEDLFLNAKIHIPKNYICVSELLLSYEAGIGSGYGATVLLHRFGKKAIIQSFLTGSFETFLFGQFELKLNGDRIDLKKDLIDTVQWKDAPYIQINSLYINENYINLDDFFNLVHSNLASGIVNMLISLNCHSDYIKTELFYKRLSKAEKDEVLKIKKHGYKWDSYNEELLRSAFVKGILKKS